MRHRLDFSAWLVPVLLLMAWTPTLGRADILVVNSGGAMLSNEPNPFAYLAALSPTDDRVVTVTPLIPAVGFYTIVESATFGPDGLVYADNTCGIGMDRWGLNGAVHDLMWSAAQYPEDMAFDSDGKLIAVQTPCGTHLSGINAVAPDASVTRVDVAPAGFDYDGLDVPRSGPYEDGIIVIARDPAGPSLWLFRYVRQPDRTFLREGPFPLSHLTPEDATCGLDLAHHTHPRARRLVDSFLLADNCTNDINEYAYDGTFLRRFAHLDRDPTVLRPTRYDPLNVYESNIQSLYCTETDDVYVAMNRRAYHLDANGNLVRMIDHLFPVATEVVSTTPVPFATAGMTCRPQGLGFWKRQCLGVDQGRPMFGAADRGSHAPPGPGLHPAFRDGGLPDLIARVDHDMAPHRVEACHALWPDDPSDPRAKALMRLTEAWFNIEDRKLDLRCMVSVDGRRRRVSDVLQDVETLLAAGTADSYRDAAHLAARLSGE